MRRVLPLLVSLIMVPALAGGYFGFRVDVLTSGAIQFKSFLERTLYSYTLFDNETRLVAGVELYNDQSGANYFTLYSGYEIDLSLGSFSPWIQLRVQSDVGIPSTNPRFRISLLGGVSW